MKLVRLKDEDNESIENDDSFDSYKNKNKEGNIRYVPNAHLIFKRKEGDGSFTELWMYKMDDFKTALETRKNILAGTDIPEDDDTSPDGKQTYELYSVGNIEQMTITGLPN